MPCFGCVHPGCGGPCDRMVSSPTLETTAVWSKSCRPGADIVMYLAQSFGSGDHAGFSQRVRPEPTRSPQHPSEDCCISRYPGGSSDNLERGVSDWWFANGLTGRGIGCAPALEQPRQPGFLKLARRLYSSSALSPAIYGVPALVVSQYSTRLSHLFSETTPGSTA